MRELPWHGRGEAGWAGKAPLAEAPGLPAGPLRLTQDLPQAPFELVLRIPGSWSAEAYQHAAVTLLERFLSRYRAFLAYGQHL